MTIRPLGKEEKKAEKQRKNLIIIGIIIIALMVFSTVGYAFFEGTFSESTKTKYNGYEFIDGGNYWQTKVTISGTEKTLNSFYLPNDIENISMTGTIMLSDFEGKIIYFITNNTNYERNTVSKIYNDFQDYFTRAQLACSIENEDTSFCSDLPVKSCEDSSENVLIIQINDIINSTTSINYKNGCLIISGEGINLIKASDKILFKAYGIMD